MTHPRSELVSGLILVVDDDASIRRMTRYVLERDGYTVIEAENGEQALMLYQECPPDLILLDALMPEMNGFDTCIRLRQLPGGDRIPILIITALNDAESVSAAFEAGASDYVVKPIHWAVLRRRVRHLLRVNQAELALRASEERYRTLVETSPDAIILLDANFNILFCNRRAAALHGFAKVHHLLGYPMLELIAPPDRLQVLDILRQTSSPDSAHTLECTLLKNSGGHFSAEVTISQLLNSGDQTEQFMLVARDITERKQAEAEIKRRNRELMLLNQIIAASAASLEPEGILEVVCRELVHALDISYATAGLFNETKTEIRIVAEYNTRHIPSQLYSLVSVSMSPPHQFLLTHHCPLVVTDIKTEARLNQMRHLLEQRGTVSLLLLPLLVEGRVVGCLNLESEQLHSFSSEEISLVWSVADHVAGVLARALLIQTREQLSAAIDQAGEAVIITDPAGTITHVNPAFERITGYTWSEVIGQNADFLKHDQPEPDFFEKLWAKLYTGEVWHGRMINKKKDGALYTAEVTIIPVRGNDGTTVNYVGIQQDVTGELQLEEQLRQSQKMEAIGRLAGGIAHDFNNLLTVINGYSDLLLTHYPDPQDPHRRDLEQIKKAGERASALTQQLLAFSRKQSLQPQILNLNEVVNNAHQLLRRLIGEDLELTLDLNPNLAQVMADPGQVEQIMFNLAVNARDAMPQGGKLVIATDNVMLDEATVRAYPEVVSGSYVLLAVTDTGVGMNQEILAHIFEPFFTTKAQGKGTGLGLATVHSIVKQHGGHIWVETEPGRGTSFKIYLPQLKTLSELPQESSSPDEVSGGFETILVVEDELSVREIMCHILEAYGYKVHQAASGPEAIHFCQEAQPESIHLLLTDVVMPGMNGQSLASDLTSRYPQLKVLYTSGYLENNLSSEDMLKSLILKPFTPDTLTRKVREVLDRGNNGHAHSKN
ncbi:MAG: PAS domain S-box protein [Anaerolineae bacterium]|nr:PAS domain S-box protein [Anaerolineae bacterium]